MAQPALKTDILYQDLAILWIQKRSIDANYLPLIRLKKEAEKLLTPGNPVKGEACLILAFVYAILWERKSALYYLEEFERFSYADNIYYVNSALIYNYFGYPAKAVEFIEKVSDAGRNNDLFQGNAYSVYVNSGFFRKAFEYWNNIKSKINPRMEAVEMVNIVKALDDNSISDFDIVAVLNVGYKLVVQANIPFMMTHLYIDHGLHIEFLLDHRFIDSTIDMLWEFATIVTEMEEYNRISSTVTINMVPADLSLEEEGASSI
ncbi:MAG: hypothetical protein G8345_09975 [Magnetococcales bacterium]|nr:hypothetical protein [Magnetococcales bacterium]NGZ27198.1 hypothetical protein [Magnetococcales bacterium]